MRTKSLHTAADGNHAKRGKGLRPAWLALQSSGLEPVLFYGGKVGEMMRGKRGMRGKVLTAAATA